eukprot:Unigene11233_Nuclearia_a/m.34346 Unigene11233_Nuclearia_a/g.34346  ORF Unigene11233_Nuclearia_a/g.34346 Unigene11233_Nuclearia_a/m.34346 type:complete len:368 (-) Unigene11233_Nuclearia_a:26-1129(-)
MPDEMLELLEPPELTRIEPPDSSFLSFFCTAVVFSFSFVRRSVSVLILFLYSLTFSSCLIIVRSMFCLRSSSDELVRSMMSDRRSRSLMTSVISLICCCMTSLINPMNASSSDLGLSASVAMSTSILGSGACGSRPTMTSPSSSSSSLYADVGRLSALGETVLKSGEVADGGCEALPGVLSIVSDVLALLLLLLLEALRRMSVPVPLSTTPSADVAMTSDRVARRSESSGPGLLSAAGSPRSSRAAAPSCFCDAAFLSFRALLSGSSFLSTLPLDGVLVGLGVARALPLVGGATPDADDVDATDDDADDAGSSAVKPFLRRTVPAPAATPFFLPDAAPTPSSDMGVCGDVGVGGGGIPTAPSMSGGT